MKTNQTASNRVCSLEKSGVRVDAGEAKDGEELRPEAEEVLTSTTQTQAISGGATLPGSCAISSSRSQTYCKTAGVVMALLIRRHWLLPLDGCFCHAASPVG